MGGVIAIDPGRRSGFAVFDSSGVLVGAGVLSDAAILARPPCPVSGVAVIEMPVVYPTRNADPNDLIDLAILVGDLRGYYRRQGFEVRLVKPRTWKGAVPKAIHNERTLRALTPEERALLPLRPRPWGSPRAPLTSPASPASLHDHNMLDAVGLGLWQLKR